MPAVECILDITVIKKKKKKKKKKQKKNPSNGNTQVEMSYVVGNSQFFCFVFFSEK